MPPLQITRDSLKVIMQFLGIADSIRLGLTCKDLYDEVREILVKHISRHPYVVMFDGSKVTTPRQVEQLHRFLYHTKVITMDGYFAHVYPQASNWKPYLRLNWDTLKITATSQDLLSLVGAAPEVKSSVCIACLQQTKHDNCRVSTPYLAIWLESVWKQCLNKIFE